MKYLVLILIFNSFLLMKPTRLATIFCSYKDNVLIIKDVDTKRVMIEKEDSRIFIKDIDHLNEADDYIQFKKDDKNVIYSLQCKNVI